MFLTCRQERECCTHRRKVRQKCGNALVFPMFFSRHSLTIILTPSVSESSPKGKYSEYRIEMAVERVVCLFCACWLVNRSLSLKFGRHVICDWLYKVYVPTFSKSCSVILLPLLQSSPAHNQQLPLGGSTSEASPQVHGEECGGRVEDRGQGWHNCRQHHRH